MLQQAIDLREEGDALHEFLLTLEESDWSRPTPFKGMTPHLVITHLYQFDRASLLALEEPEDYQAVAWDLVTEVAKECGPLAPAELRTRWYSCLQELCEGLGACEPQRRLTWFGPDMGVRMFTTARQMETWAHGQDIYDLMRVHRTNTDRIKNIAHLGAKTYFWTFTHHGKEVPGPEPYIKLTAPSGAIWEWNEPNDDNCVKGSAVEFCHVVSQGRNIADTKLTVVGEPATQWMAIAQCFAGPPTDPPKPGERAWS